jgi:hypothetical protein
MKSKKKNEITIHSSTAEYLTFIAASGDSPYSVEMRYQEENIWLTQKMMSELYDVDVRTINDHIQKIFLDNELSEISTIRNFRIVQTEGTRQVERADAEKEYMGLQTWETAPYGKIIKADVSIAKNYLNEQEMDYLERIVSVYLDFAEMQAKRKIPMSMEDWAKRLDSFLEFNGDEILTGPGKISHEQAKLHAETEFEKYRIVQDRLFQSDFDRFVELEVMAGGDRA